MPLPSHLDVKNTSSLGPAARKGLQTASFAFSMAHLGSGFSAKPCGTSVHCVSKVRKHSLQARAPPGAPCCRHGPPSWSLPGSASTSVLWTWLRDRGCVAIAHEERSEVQNIAERMELRLKRLYAQLVPEQYNNGKWWDEEMGRGVEERCGLHFPN